LKKAALCPQILSIFLLLSVAPLVSSCDESPKTEAGKAEEKELVETTEEAEGVEAAKEALKRKDEEEAKEGEERKDKQEEKKAGGEGMVKSSPGLFKKK
jgi:hypothetical protein